MLRKAQALLGGTRNRAVRSNGRTRGTWLGGIAFAALLLGGAHALMRPLRAAPPPDGLPEGASSELARARREQALIRAEGTAKMLRALDSAPTLPSGGP